MSLFSRLDRVRDKAKADAEAAEGLFAAPDLGPRDASRPAPQPVVSDVSDESPANNSAASAAASMNGDAVENTTSVGETPVVEVEAVSDVELGRDADLDAETKTAVAVQPETHVDAAVDPEAATVSK